MFEEIEKVSLLWIAGYLVATVVVVLIWWLLHDDERYDARSRRIFGGSVNRLAICVIAFLLLNIFALIVGLPVLVACALAFMFVMLVRVLMFHH